MIRSYDMEFYKDGEPAGGCAQIIAQSASDAVECAIEAGVNPGLGKFVVCVTCQNQNLHFRFEVIII